MWGGRRMKKFILGICFGTIGIPLLSAIGDAIVYSSELLKAKMGIKITEYNVKINDLNVPQTETRAIGFATTNVEEGNYE